MSYKDRRGSQTDFGYDQAGNLTSVTGPDPDGPGPLGQPVTTYTRDPSGTGLIVGVTDPRLKVTQFGYDPITHELVSLTTPLGETATFSYDTSGRLRTAVDPRGNAAGANPSEFTWSYDYDAAGHLVERTSPDPDGTGPQTALVTQWTYDPAGNLLGTTDARGHTTEYAYDPANRLAAVTAPDPDGGGPLPRPVTLYGYDEVGNQVTRTVAGSRTTTYAYDAANRLISVTSPTGKQWTYQYDTNGNRTSEVDANGNATPTPGDGTTSYTYDERGRLRTISYSDSTPAVSLFYDANDNLTGMIDGASSEGYSYDRLDRLTGVTRGANTFSYLYDAAGNITQTTYPDGTAVTAAYDDNGRRASITGGGQTTSYGYDAAGNLLTTALPAGNGHIEARSYDRAGRLTGVANTKGAATLSAFAVTLDPAGNPTSVVRSGPTSGTVTYSYDNLNRLTGVCFQASCPGAGDPLIRWSYDDVGNRLTEARPGATKTYTYNAADQLIQAGTTAYSYDHNGNQLSAGSTSFVYDLANRLVSTTSGSTTTTYSYDGHGKRLQASTGSQAAKKTNYLWDINHELPQIALERNSNDQLLRRYLYAAERISVTSGNNTSYYHRDQLGSTANVTSASGVSQWTYSYEPYGLLRTETKNHNQAPANPIKFVGEYHDPTGLYHLRAREYDPATGRFLTTDPKPRDPYAPYMSSYVYAEDQPTVLTDPSGLGAIGNTCVSIGCWSQRAMNIGMGIAATADAAVVTGAAVAIGGLCIQFSGLSGGAALAVCGPPTVAAGIGAVTVTYYAYKSWEKVYREW